MRRGLGLVLLAGAGLAVACDSDDDGGDAPQAAAVSLAAVETTARPGGPTTTVTAPATTTTAVPLVPADPVVAIGDDGRVVVLDPDVGTEVRVLATVDAAGGGVGVSQSAGVVFFSASGRVWRVAADGAEPVLVGLGAYPAVDPAGTTLALVRERGTVVLIDVADGHEIVTASLDATGAIDRLEWSPDGTAIVFSAGGGSHVFRPGVVASLVEAEPVAAELTSPTWVGPDLVEGVSSSGALRIYALGESDAPALAIDRTVRAVDRRPLGDRSAEINLDGTVTLRGVDGRAAWTTAARFVAVSA